MKFRSCKRNFARLSCENQTVKVKFCQFNLLMSYCTSGALSGKLFRTEMCLWLNSISINLLCKSKSSQLVYSLQPLKVLPSSAYHLGRPYERWAMLPLMPQWSHHTWVRVTWIFSTRVYTLMCTRSCSACGLHLFAVRLCITNLLGLWWDFTNVML